MKMGKQLYVLAISLLFFSVTIQAQEEAAPDTSIESQFNALLEKANSYKEFKVIKKVRLAAFKADVLDSLKDVRTNLSSTEQKVKDLQGEINSLKSNLATTNGNLDLVNQEKDSIEFFGNQMNKSGYKTIMWSIIGGLLALLLFFIFKFQRSNSITSETKNNLAETQNELESHKKRSLEKEQKLMRRLQDELNKRS